MDIQHACIGVILGTIAAALAWFVNWVYVRPMRWERQLRQQGLSGTSYKLFHGDTKMISGMLNETLSKPISLDGDIPSRVMPAMRYFVDKYGKISFFWVGPTPRILITDPKMVREILMDYDTFPKRIPSALTKLVFPGISSLDGERWAKRRRALNPAFHIDQIKDMFPISRECCDELIKAWETIVTINGSTEIEVSSCFTNLAGDIISRTAFGSNFEEGRKIFQLHQEQTDILAKHMWAVSIPGWRFLPTSTRKRIKELNNEVKDCIRAIVEKNTNVCRSGNAARGNLLEVMLNPQQSCMNMEEVIEECKLFYFAGAESTAVLLTWIVVLLSEHQNWQTRARDEILGVFGRNAPDFDGLSRLKVVDSMNMLFSLLLDCFPPINMFFVFLHRQVTMIINETLRLYPPLFAATRRLYKPARIGKLLLPAEAVIWLPIMLMHYDEQIWGYDSKVFNPGRFSEGVAKATNNEMAYFPFGQGPRICIGQNFTWWK